MAPRNRETLPVAVEDIQRRKENEEAIALAIIESSSRAGLPESIRDELRNEYKTTLRQVSAMAAELAIRESMSLELAAA